MEFAIEIMFDDRIVSLFSLNKSDDDEDVLDNSPEVLDMNVPMFQVTLTNGTSTISTLGCFGNIAIANLTYDNEDTNLNSTSLQCSEIPCNPNEGRAPLPNDFFLN